MSLLPPFLHVVTLPVANFLARFMREKPYERRQSRALAEGPLIPHLSISTGGAQSNIFAQSGATRMSSKQLVAALHLLPDRPWSNSSIHQSTNPSIRLTARLLALRLSPFGIHPHNIQVDGRQSKGYDLTDFTAAFSRFLAAP